MDNHILITGASGYLGGTILNRLKNIDLGKHELFALVRTTAQANNVRQYGATPLEFDVKDSNQVQQCILKHKINIVFSLVDAFTAESQKCFITALSNLKKETGQEVHFLHTSGAKMFSSHAGAPTDRTILDDEPGLFQLQKNLKAKVELMQSAVDANTAVIEECAKAGVRSYIFLPCMVYGKGEGFGNLVSIQTSAIVKAAKAAGKVYKVDEGEPSWPLCHVGDTANLYLSLLKSIASNENPDYGENGYYHASTGFVTWDSVYKGIATAMHKRSIAADNEVHQADDAAIEKMAEGLGCPTELVAVQVGGSCTFGAKRGYSIGWKPQHSTEHIYECLDAEVELILSSL